MADIMERRPLGETGISVTPIGLGLAALGRPGYIDIGRDEDLGAERGVEEMERRAHAVLDEAFEIGIRYLDAARSYGRAEQFLASWLNARGLGREDVTVGSKWGYVYVADWRVDAQVHEVKDHSLPTLRKQIAESRALLGHVLALYQIHSATLESGVLEDRQVLDELLRLREEGLVIGLSTSGPRQSETIRRALEVDVAGSNPFGAVQATWNLLETSAGPALAEAHEAGWGVLVKESMANGRLGPRGAGPQRAIVDGVAERHGVGPDAIAIAAALANPWADVVLSGAVNSAQLRSNAAALDVMLTEEERGALVGLAEPADEYWTRRSSLPWS
jgi:aryl-alcohol dehydrogenase-like predicted oxidoreductase